MSTGGGQCGGVTERGVPRQEAIDARTGMLRATAGPSEQYPDLYEAGPDTSLFFSLTSASQSV